MFSAAIDALPDTSDPEFSGRVNVILSGLRKLQTALTTAATRGRATPSVIVSLSGVRTRYDDLMAMASEAPGATLVQQLYVVRRRLTVESALTWRSIGWMSRRDRSPRREGGMDRHHRPPALIGVRRKTALDGCTAKRSFA